MSEYKFSEALLKKCGGLGIIESTPLLEGIKKLLEDMVPVIEANNSIISAFEKLKKGEMYECPHCKSDTLLDFGKCHVCDGDLFVETLNLVEPKKTTKNKKQDATAVQAAEVKTQAKPDSGKSKRDPADFRKEELEALLKQVEDKKNKEATLKVIADTLSIVLPNPDMMNASAMRNEIKKGIESLLKKAKPMPPVVEVDEDELLNEPHDDEAADEIEIDDDVEIEVDDEPKPNAPKKLAKSEEKSGSKKQNKKTKPKPEPKDDEDEDLEIDDDVIEVDDEAEEPVVKKSDKKETKASGKKDKPKPKPEDDDEDDAIEIDDEDAVELDEEDEQVAEAEVEDDDVFELEDDSEEDEDIGF